MKIKNILLIFSILFIAGCASDSKRNGFEGEDDLAPSGMENERSGNRSVPLPENVKAESRSEPSRKVSPTQASALDKAHQNLQEAIKSQNEESIIRASTQVLSANSQDIKGLNSMGLAHFKKGRLVAAQYFFGKALTANPNVSEVHNNLGLVHLSLKENRDAIKEFKKAIELDSNNSAATANLGAIYLEHKDYAKALMAMEMAIKRGNKEYKTLVNYGVALAGIGQGAQAKEQYEQAIKVNSSGREALYNLAVLYVDQLKQYQQGLDLLSKLKFMGTPDSSRMKINALEIRAKAGLQ